MLNPIGWDSFGLPAENAAIKRNEHPATYTYANIETQAESFRKYAVSFDWSRRLHTSDPEYYRWTQWLFLKLRERGLAYRKSSPVNWCPNDQTVLANEQVVDGMCERCGAEVTKRELTQWYFKVTEYAQRLLDDMDDLDWPERVLTLQRNWIGRSEGAHVDFEVTTEGTDETRTLSVYTTRPDTLFGATFMVVAADAKLAEEIVSPDQRAAYDAYLDETRKASDIDRMATDRPEDGCVPGRMGDQPGQRRSACPCGLPTTCSPTTAPARSWPCPARTSATGTSPRSSTCRSCARCSLPRDSRPMAARRSPATARRSTPPTTRVSLDGMEVDEAKRTIITYLEEQGTGRGAVNYRLRDWLLSRQRFWGCPIPVIHCEKCGEVDVPEDQLPVVLPELTGADLKPKGVSPLAAAEEWVNVDCPKCGGPAKRDSDTMDTFVDSSWYFLRYCSPHDDTQAFDPDKVRQWMPVHQYVGGVEHAVLHLLYSRFFTKVLHDMGIVDFEEPFSALLNQGVVINRGKKMSKSLGNGVDLGAQLAEFGVDAVRLTLVFAGPPEDNIDWADMSPAGSLRFLQRAWRLSGDVTSAPGVSPDGGDPALRKVTHRVLHDAAELVESHRFNVMIARMMELVNATRKAIDSGPGAEDPAVREATEAVAIMLSLVAPYTAEEMWSRLGHEPTVARAGWPTVDESLLVEDSVTAVVQVQGKLRARLQVSPDISETDLEAAAMADRSVQRSLEGKQVRKVIVRAPKLVNVVVG